MRRIAICFLTVLSLVAAAAQEALTPPAPTYEGLLVQARALFQAGKLEDALARVKEAGRLAPEPFSYEPLELQARILLKMFGPDMAEASLDFAIHLAPPGEQARLQELAKQVAMPPPPTPAELPSPPIDIGKCYGPFRCESYLEAAEALQALPETQRLAQLRAWTAGRNGIRGNGELETQVVVLCRMLFEPKEGQTFRAAIKGGPVYVGDPPGLDPYQPRSPPPWPLVPITLVDGIPFCIQTGTGTIAGQLESAENYLYYCSHEFQWTSRRYAPATLEARQKALAKLINDHAWPRPLTDKDTKFLSDQLLPPAVAP